MLNVLCVTDCCVVFSHHHPSHKLIQLKSAYINVNKQLKSADLDNYKPEWHKKRIYSKTHTNVGSFSFKCAVCFFQILSSLKNIIIMQELRTQQCSKIAEKDLFPKILKHSLLSSKVPPSPAHLPSPLLKATPPISDMLSSGKITPPIKI